MKVVAGSQYVSPHLESIPQQNQEMEFGDYAPLLDMLSKRQSQDDISLLFKEKGISPSSLSSIEKRLHQLRTDFKANNVVHLVSIVKDLGLI